MYTLHPHAKWNGRAFQGRIVPVAEVNRQGYSWLDYCRRSVHFRDIYTGGEPNKGRRNESLCLAQIPRRHVELSQAKKPCDRSTRRKDLVIQCSYERIGLLPRTRGEMHIETATARLLRDSAQVSSRLGLSIFPLPRCYNVVTDCSLVPWQYLLIR